MSDTIFTVAGDEIKITITSLRKFRLSVVYTCLQFLGRESTRYLRMRYAVGCKPREAVLYPDTVAGANPKVGPYCSSRWLLEGLWLMQRSEFGDSRGSATAPLHAQPQTEGRPDLGTFRCVRYGSARFDGESVSGSTRRDPVTGLPHVTCVEKCCLNYLALARRRMGYMEL